MCIALCNKPKRNIFFSPRFCLVWLTYSVHKTLRIIEIYSIFSAEIDTVALTGMYLETFSPGEKTDVTISKCFRVECGTGYVKQPNISLQRKIVAELRRLCFVSYNSLCLVLYLTMTYLASQFRFSSFDDYFINLSILLRIADISGSILL